MLPVLGSAAQLAFDSLVEHSLIHLTIMVDDDGGDDHGEEEGQDNGDLVVHLLDVVILHSLLHPTKQIPF